MRRSDREVINQEAIINIINDCSCCRLGLNDDGEVYIVPLNFGFEYKDGQYVFYFHSAKQGRKIDIIGRNPNVGFELDTHHEVYSKEPSDIACNCSARFQSVIGTGVVSFVTDLEEKKRGLLLLMRHSTGKPNWTFDEKRLEAVEVIKLVVTALSCKEHE